MKKLLLYLTLISCAFASSIQSPSQQFIAKDSVTDIVYHEGKLYAATSASCVNIFDVNTQKIIQTIQLEKTIDFMNEKIDSKVYSVDIFKNKILLLSQAQKGARRLDRKSVV